jgi:F-type H+-transporting ATPase subunit O
LQNATNSSPQYTAAAKQSALDNTSRAIASLATLMKNEPRLQTLIAAPTLQQADKSAIVAELEKHTGGADKSGIVKNFLATLAENNRLGLLTGVCGKFAELISASKGEIELRITSAAVC